MKHSRALTLAAASAVAVSGLTATTAAAASNEPIPAGLTTINLLGINDFHGRIDDGSMTGNRGRLFACSLVNTRTAMGPDSTLFISAGDNVGGTPFASSVQGDQPTIDYLNALGLQSSAVGNHEFDKGWADLRDRIDPAANWPYLAANVYARGTTTPVLPTHSVHTVSGIRVGIIGAVTRETPSMVSPDSVTAIDFGDPVAAVNRVAAELSDGNEANGEADVLVAMYHEGATDGTPDGSTLATEVAEGGAFGAIVTGTSAAIDAIYTGHSHKVYTWDAPIPGGTGTRPIVQSDSYGALIGAITLGVDPATKTVRAYQMRNINTLSPSSPSGACLTNPAYLTAEGIVTAAIAQAKILGQPVVGTITTDITTAYRGTAPTLSRDDRLSESTLGNLTAQVWKDSMSAPGRPGADIGIMNPGGLRAELLYAPSGIEGPGQVTYAEVASVHPFANTLQTRDLTGAQFKAVLEQQWQPAGARSPYLQLGLSDNVTYTYDPNRAVGDRITSIWIDGGPIDAAGSYRVASSSFLMAGGDNFTAVRQGVNFTDSGLIDTDAFVNWFKARTAPVAPSFAKQAVAVIPAVSTLQAEATATFEVQGLDFTSLAAPDNSVIEVRVGDKLVGTYPVANTLITTPLPPRTGNATVTFEVAGSLLTRAIQTSGLKPGSRTAPAVMTVTAPDSGTVVHLPVTIVRNGKGRG